MAAMPEMGVHPACRCDAACRSAGRHCSLRSGPSVPQCSRHLACDCRYHPFQYANGAYCRFHFHNVTIGTYTSDSLRHCRRWQRHNGCATHCTCPRSGYHCPNTAPCTNSDALAITHADDNATDKAPANPIAADCAPGRYRRTVHHPATCARSRAESRRWNAG